MSHAGSTLDKPTVVVNGATVAAAGLSVISAANVLSNSYGRRMAAVHISCNTTHTVRFFGGWSPFTAITGANELLDHFKNTQASTAGTLGRTFYVPVAGLAYFIPVVTNTSGGNATVSISVSFYNA